MASLCNLWQVVWITSPGNHRTNNNKAIYTYIPILYIIKQNKTKKELMSRKKSTVYGRFLSVLRSVFPSKISRKNLYGSFLSSVFPSKSLSPNSMRATTIQRKQAPSIAFLECFYIINDWHTCTHFLVRNTPNFKENCNMNNTIQKTLRRKECPVNSACYVKNISWHANSRKRIQICCNGLKLDKPIFHNMAQQNA